MVALVTAALLVAAGFVLRVALPVLRWLYIPASVIGGLVGLAMMQALRYAPARNGFDPAAWARDTSGTLSGWPGPLLALIFAALLLEKPSRSMRESFRGAARQGVMVWIIALGQVLCGLLVTWLIVRPVYGVPPVFGQLIEAGFVGGHGTASGMGDLMREVYDFAPGRDLGMTFATVGLVGGVVTGIAYVNIAVRLGWTNAADLRPVSGLEAMRHPRPAAMARVSSDVIDPMAMQLLIVALAFAIGWAYQWLFVTLAGGVADEEAMKYVASVPLFLFTLLGGLTLRYVLSAIGYIDLVDPDSLKRICGMAIELLIVAAIASLRIEAVASYLWPVLLMLALGFAWSTFCLFVLAKRLLPRGHWLELGLINYGMSTGTTAQGMMLLRIVDRDMTSGAAEDYALAAPLSAPFIGGGVVTFIGLPVAMAKLGMGPVVCAIAVALVTLYLVGRRLNRAEL